MPQLVRRGARSITRTANAFRKCTIWRRLTLLDLIFQRWRSQGRYCEWRPAQLCDDYILLFAQNECTYYFTMFYYLLFFTFYCNFSSTTNIKWVFIIANVRQWTNYNLKKYLSILIIHFLNEILKLFFIYVMYNIIDYIHIYIFFSLINTKAFLCSFISFCLNIVECL